MVVKMVKVLLPVCGFMIGATSSIAMADEYFALNAPLDPITKMPDPSKEINASQGGLNAYALVAAGRMGLMFYNGTAMTESSLLQKCKTYSPLGTTWKDGCDIGGLATGMAMMVSHPNWIVLKHLTESAALTSIVDGMKLYNSPVLVPLYGHATHWATIYMIAVSGSTLEGLEWFDSGPANQKDGQFTYYNDGVQGADDKAFANSYYDLLNSPYLSASDPYKSKYVVVYDPPSDVTAEHEIHRAVMTPPLQPRMSQGVVGPEEAMTAKIAQERVWDALLLSSIPQSPVIWPAIQHGTAGAAWLVRGFGRLGVPWDYYLVPLLAEDGSTLGLVQLSAENGAFQQVWAPRVPSPFLGITPAEAACIANDMRREGEQFVQGELTWDPAVEDPLAPSPLFPYYQFYVLSKEGGYCGDVRVTLKDGEASFHPSVGKGSHCASR